MNEYKKLKFIIMCRKTLITAAVIVAPFVANAQNNSPALNEDVFKICATIFTAGLFMIFILAIIKRLMDYSLKNKIVEKGIPENIALSILKTNPKEDRNSNIKWFLILSALGIGITIINYTLPLGYHSLAIIAFSIATGFLGHYFFLRQSEE